MQRGVDLEPAAFAEYQIRTGNVAFKTGFLAHNELAVGCSLDGHVGEFEGICEFKCPKSSTHLRYLRGGTVPTDYLPQITHNLWVTGAAWCDFVSFDDRFPRALQVFIVRVPRDEKAIATYQDKALAFLEEVATEVAAVRTMTDVGAVLKEAVA
jgi:hypothetical protein